VADKKISALTALVAASVASGDVLAVVDVSATETKKITATDLATAVTTLGVLATEAYADAAVLAAAVDFSDANNILANAAFG
jgi:hypothetical protein